MAIFINNTKQTVQGARELLAENEPGSDQKKAQRHEKQIVTAWHKSEINHCFNNEKKKGKKKEKKACELFKDAVRKNQKALESDENEKIKKFFTRGNYCFSTKACNREETLYFKNCATKQTGRLRQQHSHGPLAKIDKAKKTHLFLEEDRFRYLKRWHKKNKRCRPDFKSTEERLKNGKHHIEFAILGKKISGWHASEGRVERDTRGLGRRIASALENILGICNKRIRK